ncbi:hypothetical protein RIF29_40364 [Crotalaria pallida]|uniref:Uncharacterized protein n=1 Tax=Crotalaria pallida TaxID=3830 RepID=A0AAN9E311_CROPI
MVASATKYELTSSVNTRLLKREEYNNRTKHDSHFSPWKILIGPCDWEDYSKGKEGCTRYRIHNLPHNSGAGVYELAIAAAVGLGGRDIYKIAPHRIVVVYIGEADNVRARLQHYGRTGAHLGNPLFHDIFSLGYPILFRWAPMQNKEDAKRTESQLLSTFDYAWNTSNNGPRRPDDILQKLNKIASRARTFSDVAKVLLPFNQKQVGIPIKSRKLPPTDDNKSDEEDNGGFNFLSRVFKFNRSRPRIVKDIVQDIGEAIQENDKICGVALGDGSVCRRPPAERRKRCPEHKGMRTNAPKAKAIIRTPKSDSESIVVLESNVLCQKKDNGHDVKDLPQEVVESPADESISNTNICGIILDDGSTCRKQPVKGRKRCLEHKGKRIRASVLRNQK